MPGAIQPYFLGDTAPGNARERAMRPKTNPFKAVVKPVEGAGSDGVFICDSPEAVRKALTALEGTKNVLGLTNYAVLLQEYLRGDEYVVDTRSTIWSRWDVLPWDGGWQLLAAPPAQP